MAQSLLNEVLQNSCRLHLITPFTEKEEMPLSFQWIRVITKTYACVTPVNSADRDHTYKISYSKIIFRCEATVIDLTAPIKKLSLKKTPDICMCYFTS